MLRNVKKKKRWSRQNDIKLDDHSYNIWDGLPDDTHLNFNTNKDHLQRALMDVNDRREWTNQLQNKQIINIIKESSRFEWGYKRVNKRFLKHNRSNGIRVKCENGRKDIGIKKDWNGNMTDTRENSLIIEREYNA